MSRRLLNLGLVLAIALGASTVAPNLAAEATCDPSGICTVGIPSGRMADIQASQQMSEWCWAASISMVVDFHGHPLDQADIVRRIWGDVVNLPAMSGTMIVGALARTWTDKSGTTFRARGLYTDYQSGVATVDVRVMIDELRKGRPLIIGTLGHAMVVTALTFNRNTGQLLDVTVRDPWPTPEAPNGRRRSLTAREVMAANFAVTVEVMDADVPQRVPCTHPAHPNGDVSPCVHRAHPSDIVPCSHLCGFYFGRPVPCHPAGDMIPCVHPMHPAGDVSPCVHPLHPMGDLVSVPAAQ